MKHYICVSTHLRVRYKGDNNNGCRLHNMEMNANRSRLADQWMVIKVPSSTV